jgi:hypothetical protein
MSTSIATIQSAIPAELRAQFAAVTTEDLARLGSVGGGDMIRISQDKQFIMPDGSSIAGPLSVVILDFVYNNNYYIGQFNRKDIQPAACFAISEHATAMVPSDKSPKKQAEACDTCQHNQWGSSPTGDGKACKNNVLIAVIPTNATEDTDPFIIRLSPTAITAFNKYVATLNRAGAPLTAVITNISFAEDTQYPTLRFDFEAGNPNNEIALFLRSVARTRLLQEPDTSGFKDGKTK